MSERRVRVLVVDDSAFARKVLREVISAHAELEVVGVARDGVDALEQIEALHPDVVTLDLVMPELDGVGVLQALRSRADPPAVVVVSMADDDSELGVAALQAGAFDVVHKPTALARKGIPPGVERSSLPKATASRAAKRTTLVVVGASTGGPQAVTRLVGALPADFPVPVLIVLHMPAGYTEPLARRLDQDSAIDVIQ